MRKGERGKEIDSSWKKSGGTEGRAIGRKLEKREVYKGIEEWSDERNGREMSESNVSLQLLM